MARFDKDGCKVATNLFEAAAWHYSVRVSCLRCGNVAVFDPHALWWLFHRKGWSEQLRDAAYRMACSTCRAKYPGKRLAPALIELCRDRPTVTHLPMPDEREWKRTIRRYRG